jgi:FdhD protein
MSREQNKTEIKSFTAFQFRGGVWREIEDAVTVEEPLEIRVDNRRYTATMRTPLGEVDDLLLAQGLLFTEGVIESLDDIEEISFSSRCRDLNDDLVNVVNVTLHDAKSVPPHLFERSIISNSSCGLCGKASVEALTAQFEPLPVSKIPLEALAAMPDKMREEQKVFGLTGGIHAAAIFDAISGEMLCAFEDIGRHNATDKAIGFGLEKGFIPANKSLVLLVSGRASFEIVQKALRACIATVAAVSAPSSLAIELAKENNLNLVGFLRQTGLTLYTGEPQ